MGGLVHPLIIGRCFVALLVLELDKKLGFVPNKKKEQFVVNVVLHARDIPNSCVAFLKDDGGYVILAFLKHEDVNYKVYNPKFEWAYCECF